MRVKKAKKRGKVRVSVTPLASGMFEVLHEVLYDDGSEEEALLIGPVTAQQAADSPGAVQAIQEALNESL